LLSAVRGHGAGSALHWPRIADSFAGMMRSSAAMFLAITLAATLFAAVPARAQNPFTIFERLFGPRWQPEAPAKPEPPREREDPLVGGL